MLVWSCLDMSCIERNILRLCQRIIKAIILMRVTKLHIFFANIEDGWFQEHLQPPGVLNVCDLKSKDIFRSTSFCLPDKRRYYHLGNLKYLKVQLILKTPPNKLSCISSSIVKIAAVRNSAFHTLYPPLPYIF